MRTRCGSPVTEPSAAPADAELVARIRRGDAEAYDALVGRYMRVAYRIAFRLLGHREDAEDLVQDAFVAALENLDGFRPGRSFKPWLVRILVNRGTNARRARAVRVTEPLPDDAVASVPPPDRDAEQAELRDRTRAALDALPERQRIIAELFELEGFTGAEIAEMLEISPGTVRWHLHQARGALRAALASHARSP